MSGKKGAGGRAARGRNKYQEDHISDEDEELVHKFDVGEKLESKNFPRFFVSEITGEEVSDGCPSTGTYVNTVLMSFFTFKC